VITTYLLVNPFPRLATSNALVQSSNTLFHIATENIIQVDSSAASSYYFVAYLLKSYNFV